MDLKAWVKNVSDKNNPARKIVGVIFIILGFLALITPFTPGSWLIFVGLEIFGLRLVLWEKIKSKFSKKP